LPVCKFRFLRCGELGEFNFILNWPIVAPTLYEVPMELISVLKKWIIIKNYIP